MLEIEHPHAPTRAFESGGSIRSFLWASEEIRFESQSRQESYAWIVWPLVPNQYTAMPIPIPGLVYLGLPLRSHSRGLHGVE